MSTEQYDDQQPENILASLEPDSPEEDDFDPRFERQKDKIDIFLTALVTVLVLALLGFAGYFTWRVVADNKIAKESNAQYRMIEQIKQELKKSPNNATLRIRLGEAYMSSGNYKEAVKEFKNAIKLKKDHAGAYYDLGMAFLYLDQPKDAEQAFAKVIELTNDTQYSNINTTREGAFYAMGRIYLDTKKYEKAAGYFKEALRINSGASDTYIGLALCLMGLKQYDGAIEQLSLGAKFDPSNSELNYLLGECYTEKGDKVNAVYYYANAYSKNPDQPEVKKAIESYGDIQQYVTAAKTALAANDLNKARDNIIIATNLAVDDVDIMMLHIDIADKMKKYDECLLVAQSGLDRNADSKEFKALVAKYKKLAPKDEAK